jgi:cysteine-rich repeat protein
MSNLIHIPAKQPAAFRGALSKALHALSIVLLLGGCSRFDPKLYKDKLAHDMNAKKDAGGGGDKDAGADSGTTGGGGSGGHGGKGGSSGGSGTGGTGNDTDAGNSQLLVPTDKCDDNPPVVTGSLSMLNIDTTGDHDDFNKFSSCSGHDAPGNDAFFAIDVQAGEKWHFHVIDQSSDAKPGNASVYLLPSCDSRACQPRNALDLCGPGTDEHFTFVASTAGHWYLGIDDRIAGAHKYKVVALRTTCGDGTLEHGEACDDGDRDLIGAGDECDANCRSVIPDKANAVEKEPNDDWTVANMLQMPDNGPAQSSVMKVKGSIASICDYDMFAVNVKQGWGVEVDLHNTNGTPCGKIPCQTSDDTAYCFCGGDAGAGTTTCDFPTHLRLELLDADGALVLASGAPTATNDCPQIEATEMNSHNLDEGLYFVRLWGAEKDPELRYEMTITMAKP